MVGMASKPWLISMLCLSLLSQGCQLSFAITYSMSVWLFYVLPLLFFFSFNFISLFNSIPFTFLFTKLN